MLGSGIVCPACKMIICQILAFLSETCLTYTTNCVSIVVIRIIIGLVHCCIELFLIKTPNGRLNVSVFKKDVPKIFIEFTFLVLSTKQFRVHKQLLLRVFLLALVFSVLKRCVRNQVLETFLQNLFPPFDILPLQFSLLYFLFDTFLQSESLCQLLFS